MHRRSSWLTRTWLALLLLVPFAAGCDAGPGAGGGRTPTPQPATARSTPPPARLPLLNQAVPPGPRRPAVAVHRAKAGKPMPKLRQAVVKGAREARAEALAAKQLGGKPAKPVADARPWGLLPPAKPATPTATPSKDAGPQPIVTAAPARPDPPAPQTPTPADRWVVVVGDDQPGPLDGLDWTVPLALLAGLLATIFLGLRKVG